jgi:Pilin accessory protein (PilO)
VDLSAPERIEVSNASTDKAGVLLYNGKPYAVGLLWLTAAQEETAKVLLKQRIKKTGADFYALRTHISQQQGFGWLRKGHRRGMQAAAAVIADQLVGEWHGVFEADNGWWYVQVRSDTLVPNGDRFFTSEEDAYQLFQQEAQLNVWPHSYAPEKWSLTGSTVRELKLANMLDDLATAPLVPTNITSMFGSLFVRNLALVGFIASIVIMMAVIGFTVYSGMQEEITPMPRVPARAASNALIAPKAMANESVSPLQLIKQCGNKLSELYQPLPGWKPQVFSCNPTTASMTWQQNTGTLGDAKDVGFLSWPATVKISFTNRILTALLPVGNLPKLAPSELPTQEDALLYLEQNLQPLGALQVKPVTPPTPPAPVSTDPSIPAPPPPPPPLPYLEISLTSGFGPDRVAPLLTGAGLELLKFEWNMPQSAWQYTLKWTYQRPAPATTNVVAPAANASATPTATPTPTAVPATTAPAGNTGATPATPLMDTPVVSNATNTNEAALGAAPPPVAANGVTPAKQPMANPVTGATLANPIPKDISSKVDEMNTDQTMPAAAPSLPAAAFPSSPSPEGAKP